MKKLIKVLLIVGLLVSAVNAKGIKIFDLKDQYFSGTMLKKGQEGFGQEQKYDLPKVIVTTDTRFNGYSYMFGLFTVDLKESIKNWNINIKKKNGVYYSNNSTLIRFTSENGESDFIVFHQSKIDINNKTFNTDRVNDDKLSIIVKKRNNNIIFKINGKAFLKKDAKDFGNLSKVEVELNDNYYDDELYALDIYEVK